MISNFTKRILLTKSTDRAKIALQHARDRLSSPLLWAARSTYAEGCKIDEARFLLNLIVCL